MVHELEMQRQEFRSIEKRKKKISCFALRLYRKSVSV